MVGPVSALGSFSALGAFLGAGMGLGLLLITAGFRRSGPAGQSVETERTRSRTDVAPLWFRVERPVLRLGLGIGLGVLVGVSTRWPVGALLAGLAGAGAPSLFTSSTERAGGLARIEAVAGWAEMLRDTMAGASGVEQAILATATVAPLPIRAEVATLATALQHGEHLGPALRGFADQVADPTCDLVCASLVMAAEHQARRLGELLGTLADAAREQATMRLRVEAGRARTRTSIRIVVGATGVLVLGLAVLDGGYLSPYSSAAGQLVLLLVGSMFALAFTWLVRMSRPQNPERILAPPELEHSRAEVLR
ncbi:MAG: type II secretion system F family protein [Acidimicrobiales bacterium]